MIEPSSTGTRWGRTPRAPSSEPRLSEEEEASGRRIARASDSSGDLHAPKKEDVLSIIESTTDPLNRYYRYPAAQALLPILGRLPITPNHVTYAHIVCGLVAGGLVAFTREPKWLVVAFVLLEVRMILDCFDGVLARARGTSSPFGRALDEIADTIALITLIFALNVRLYAETPGVVLAIFTCVLLSWGGLSANAWDFYKRKITTALRDGKDGVLDEIRQKKEFVESGKGGVLAYWGVYFDSFQFWLYDVAPVKGNRVSVIRSRVNNPAFRRFAKLLSFLSFDNGLTLLHIGVLTGLFVESEILSIGWGMFMWLATAISARIVLRAPRAREKEDTEPKDVAA